MKLEPMLAYAKRKIFDDPEWSFELKYDGFRALLVRDEAGTRFLGARGSDFSSRLSELADIAKLIKARSLVLDGEIVAGDGDIESFHDLRMRYARAGITSMQPKSRARIKYVAFDALLVNGKWLLAKPLRERRAELRKLIPKSSGTLARSKDIVGRGTELLEEAKSRGFEGVIAKRIDSTYEFGKRSRDWLRIELMPDSKEGELIKDLSKRR